MTPEEMKSIVDDIKNSLTEMKGNQLTPEKVDELIASKIEGSVKSEDLEALKTAINEEVGLKITDLKNQLSAEKDEKKSFREILEGQKEAFEKLESKGGEFHSLSVKTDVLLSSITTDKVGEVIPGFNRAAHANYKLAGIMNTHMVGADSHGQIFYTDQTTTTRNAAAKAEGAAAPESAIAWTGRSINLEEIKDSIPVSKKTLRHISQMESEIINFIQTNLMLKENADLWSGDGNTPNIKGIYTYADTFNYGAYSGTTFTNASLYDLVPVLQDEIENGYQSKYKPDVMVINPTDKLRMLGEKDDNGQYVIPPFVQIRPDGGMTINGVEVVTDSTVTANTMLIGDFRHAHRYIGENITLEWGYTGNQFTEGLVTLYGHLDECLLVKTIDTGAFLKVADITAAIAAINAAT